MSALDHALKTLDDLAALQPDWDSYGALVMDARALAGARVLAAALASAGYDFINACPENDGSITMVWSLLEIGEVSVHITGGDEL